MKHIKITWQSDQMREKDLGRGCSVPAGPIMPFHVENINQKK
jgi:hypothetical protein